jgi:hypothetical protein
MAPLLGALLSVLMVAVVFAVPAGAQDVDGVIGGADPAGVAVFQPGELFDTEIDPVPGAVSIAAVPGGASGDVWIATEAGEVMPFGSAPDHGDIAGINHAPVVAIAAGSSVAGYWLASSDGGVFAFGDAGFHGSMGGVALAEPIVGMASTPTGGGYWLVAADGGVFAFGDAVRLIGDATKISHGLEIEGPVVGVAGRPTGDGYVIAVDDVVGGLSEFEAFLLTLSPERIAIWDRLAVCESGGNWSINTRNGFYGGVQFSARSWAAAGGDGLPHQATRAEQIYRAERLLDIQGWGAWPACSRKLGLR